MNKEPETCVRDLPEDIKVEILTLEVTTRCNSRCAHCFARVGLEGRKSIPLDTAKQIITEGFGLGYRKLHLTGGEALLWEDFFSLVERAFGLGYTSVFFNSNGSLLDRELCERLASFGPELSLSISLQGPQDLHDRIRGDGAWERAIAGISSALEAGLKLEIFTTVGRSLIPELPRYAGWLFSEFSGIGYLKLIQLIRVTADELDLSEELLRPQDFISMVQSASLLNLYGHRVSVLDNPLASVAAARLGMPWLPQALPLNRPGRIVVMADLSMTHSHSNRESLGVYSPGALERTLGLHAYWKAVDPDTKICPQCPNIGLCREHEMIRPSEWYRDMNPGVPFCRRVLDSI